MTNPELKRPRGSQYYFVRVVVRGKIQWCNTGMRTAKEAREVCTGAKVGELQQAAAIDILTQDVIQRLTGTQKATFAEAVETWASEMTLSIAPLTLYNYRANILQFLRAHGLMDQPVNPPHRAVINDWVNRGGIGARKSRLRSLQSFFKCLHALGFLFTDPTALAQINLREMVVEERLPRKVLPFTEGEYQRLISSPKASSFWKVLVAFGYWTGLRLRDIVELRWASIREDRLVVFQGKTGQPVELFLSDPAIGSEDLRNAIA
jgi:integrase